MKDVLKSVHKTVPVISKDIQINVSDFCPFKCSFCPSKDIRREPNFINVSTYKKILDKCAESGYNRIWLSPMMGEFTYHPEWKEILTYTDEHPDIKNIMLFQNLLALTPSKIHFMNQTKKVHYSISINGLSEEDFKTQNNTRTSIRHALDVLYECTPEKYELILSSPGPYLKAEVMSRFTKTPNFKGSNWAGLSPNDYPALPGECRVLKYKNMIMQNGDYILCGCRDVFRETKIGNIFEESIQEIQSKPEFTQIPDLCSRCNGV